jgi:hypothetical protein
MEEKAKPFGNIWNVSNDIVEKNENVKKAVHSDMPDTDLVATNVNGYVINDVGNIVAQFGFFLDNDEKPETIELKISVDGFLGRIYNEPTNIILGYGHPTGFTGLVDPKFTQILHLGPDATNGDDIIVSIPNDDTLQEKGVNFIIRDIDVQIDLLSDDVREDFQQSLEDAAEEIDDMNELESSYNSYMRHLYVVLGEQYVKGNEPEEEEFYE